MKARIRLTTEFRVSLTDPIESGAIILAAIAWPDESPDGNRLLTAHTSIMSHLLRSAAKADPDYAWRAQRLKPGYLMVSAETAARSVKATTKRMREGLTRRTKPRVGGNAAHQPQRHDAIPGFRVELHAERELAVQPSDGGILRTRVQYRSARCEQGSRRPTRPAEGATLMIAVLPPKKHRTPALRLSIVESLWSSPAELVGQPHQARQHKSVNK